MGKRQKDETPNINAVPNKDIIQRLNFLYQASVYLQSLDIGQTTDSSKDQQPTTTVADPEERPLNSESNITKTKPKRRRKPTPRRTTNDLARDYVRCMRQVAQKTTVKIDPSMKRSLCFSCNSPLLPGVSVSVRLKNSKKYGSHIQSTCSNCKTSRRIPSMMEKPGSSSRVSTNNTTLLTNNETAAASTSAQDSPFPQQHPTTTKKEKKSKFVSHRRLPLFARPDAGHVIFRGDERFSLEEIGCVPFV